MSSRAWDISSRCFFRVKPLIVIFRSSKLPFIIELASGLGSLPVFGDFLGTRGMPRVAPSFILSNRPLKNEMKNYEAFEIKSIYVCNLGTVGVICTPIFTFFENTCQSREIKVHFL